MHSLTVFLSAKEQGKTTSLQWLVERHRQKGHVFIVADAMSHWVERRGVYVTDGEDGERAAREAIELSERLRAGVTLVLDEGWLYLHRDDPPPKTGALVSILRTGRQPKLRGSWRRRYPVCTIAATHQPSDLMKWIRNLISRLYVGHMSAPEDLDWVARITRDPVFAYETAPSLPWGEFVAFDL